MLPPTSPAKSRNPAKAIPKKILNWVRAFSAVACRPKVCRPACRATALAAQATLKDGAVAYPRLAGQHKSYVVDQLRSYQSGQRTNSIMGDIAKRMSNEEMDAVGNFIQGLQ